jgi:RNA polymerase subunit RPABC4/transcription elongation factor Spt4
MRHFILTLAVLLSASAFAHEGHHHGSHSKAAKSSGLNLALTKAYDEINFDYAKSIKPIFENKCAACHSTEVSAPWYGSVPIINWIIESDRSEAKEHLEISKGFPFAGHGTPEEDLDAIKKEVEEGSMPPTLYRWMHSDSKITSSEKTLILKWIDSSKGKLTSVPENHLGN